MPLVPLSMQVSCRSSCALLPLALRPHAVGAAFRAVFVTLVPFVLRFRAACAALFYMIHCSCAFLIIIINVININIIVNILSCFASKPLLRVILRATSD